MATTKKTQTTKRKGNPAKQAQELKISAIGDFKKRLGGVMELPSGAVVRLKNPGGLAAFLGENSEDIPNPLMTLVQDSLKKGKAPSTAKVTKQVENDPELLMGMQMMMERAVVKSVVEPPVLPRPTQKDLDVWNAENPDDQLDDVEELRDENYLYADEFPDVDKQFIFQWITGGVKDLETFRQKQQSMLGLVESEPGTEDHA